VRRGAESNNLALHDTRMIGQNSTLDAPTKIILQMCNGKNLDSFYLFTKVEAIQTYIIERINCLFES